MFTIIYYRFIDKIIHCDGDRNMREIHYTRSHSWWPPRPPWIALILVLILAHLANSSITCGPGIQSAGGKET